MRDNTEHSNLEKDTYSLRDLLLLLNSYIKEYWLRKWWISLFISLSIGYMVHKAQKDVVLYTADLTYLLNQTNNNFGAISGLLGSFGLNRSSNVNLDKVVELSKSRRIIHNVLFTKIQIDTFGNNSDFVINHLIKLYPKLIQNIHILSSAELFYFKNDSIDHFDYSELSILKVIYEKVIGTNSEKGPVFTNTYSADTGILKLSVSTPSESLSIQLCELLYENLKRYYILSNTSANQNALNFVQQKADSIYTMLKATEFQLTTFNDRNRNVIDPNIIAQRRIIETELLKLKTMYGEVTKNEELADFSLTAGTPEMIIIDAPILPLDAKILTLSRAIILGLLAGVIVGVFFFTFRKLLLDALRKHEYTTA
jgi:hypothetical protein